MAQKMFRFAVVFLLICICFKALLRTTKKHGVSVEPSFFPLFDSALSVIGAEVREVHGGRQPLGCPARALPPFFEVDVLYTWTSLTLPCTIMNLSIVLTTVDFLQLSSIIDIIMYRCFFFFGIRLYSDVHQFSVHARYIVSPD